MFDWFCFSWNDFKNSIENKKNSNACKNKKKLSEKIECAYNAAKKALEDSWNPLGAKYFVVHKYNNGTGWLEDENDKIYRDDGYYMRPVINVSRTDAFCVDDPDSDDVGTIDNPIIIGETCGW